MCCNRYKTSVCGAFILKHITSYSGRSRFVKKHNAHRISPFKWLNCNVIMLIKPRVHNYNLNIKLIDICSKYFRELLSAFWSDIYDRVGTALTTHLIGRIALTVPANNLGRNQSNSFVLYTRALCISCITFKMSAVSMYPMCVRASRGLLRLRQGTTSTAATAVLDVFRGLSTDTTSSSATGGLAQAILQERLQQQQKSQVSVLLWPSDIHTW